MSNSKKCSLNVGGVAGSQSLSDVKSGDAIVDGNGNGGSVPPNNGGGGGSSGSGGPDYGDAMAIIKMRLGFNFAADPEIQKRYDQVKENLPEGSEPLVIDKDQSGNDVIMHSGNHYTKSDGSSGGNGMIHTFENHLHQFQKPGRFGKDANAAQIAHEILMAAKFGEETRVRQNRRGEKNAVYSYDSPRFNDGTFQVKIFWDQNGAIKSAAPY